MEFSSYNKTNIKMEIFNLNNNNNNNKKKKSSCNLKKIILKRVVISKESR